LSGTTLELSTADHGAAWWISSQPGLCGAHDYAELDHFAL
jgi:hypothetical protein